MAALSQVTSLPLLLLLVGCADQVPQRRFPTEAEALLRGFQDTTPTVGAYDSLFQYFVLGWDTYRLPTGSGATYPGLPSQHGAGADRMEGFARLAPMVAAWLASGRPSSVEPLPGRDIDLSALLSAGILAGTDPKSSGYWGKIVDRDQRIVEASDVALVLWLTRHTMWPKLTAPEQAQVGRWLYQVNGKQVSDNNWHLFITFTNVVLEALGQPADRAAARQHYLRMKSFYRGDGWFSDGPLQAFDYYNAWGIHYQLYWLAQVDPSWDVAFIRETFERFLGSYRYLFGSKGFPIRGRSVCYRMAVPAPLIAAQSIQSRPVPADEARRALDQVWQYFIAHGAVRAGTTTQGYCGPDPRILDNYSGPASCLWSLRSLVLAFALPPTDHFWRARPGRSPVDTADVDVRIAAIGWRIVGEKGSGFVSIINADSLRDGSGHELHTAGPLQRLRERIFRRPFRPNNMAAKYRLPVYRGDRPFCGCTGAGR